MVGKLSPINPFDLNSGCNVFFQRIMDGISVSGEVGGAGGAYSYNALKRLDQIWSRICSGQEGDKFSDLILLHAILSCWGIGKAGPVLLTSSLFYSS